MKTSVPEFCATINFQYLRLELTMETMIEVEVEED